MPSRPVTLAIVALWLAAAGWMVYRELWQKAGEPPPFTVDLADEVGAQLVPWEVEQDGRPAGSATTRVQRTPDRAFKIHCLYKPDGLRLRGLPVRKLTGTYYVTPRGALRGVEAEVSLSLLWGLRFRADLEGSVEGGRLRLRTGPGEHEVEEIAVAANGKVLNPLHPLHKLTGLSQGMAWQLPLLDPAGAAHRPAGSAAPRAHADVTRAELASARGPVVCWCVTYRLDGQPAARVWARANDGTVLRQEAIYPTTTIVLRRRTFP